MRVYLLRGRAPLPIWGSGTRTSILGRQAPGPAAARVWTFIILSPPSSRGLAARARTSRFGILTGMRSATASLLVPPAGRLGTRAGPVLVSAARTGAGLRPGATAITGTRPRAAEEIEK